MRRALRAVFSHDRELWGLLQRPFGYATVNGVVQESSESRSDRRRRDELLLAVVRRVRVQCARWMLRHLPDVEQVESIADPYQWVHNAGGGVDAAAPYSVVVVCQSQAQRDSLVQWAANPVRGYPTDYAVTVACQTTSERANVESLADAQGVPHRRVPQSPSQYQAEATSPTLLGYAQHHSQQLYRLVESVRNAVRTARDVQDWLDAREADV